MATALSIPARRAESASKLAVNEVVAKHACEKSLLTYIRDAWPVLEPTIPFLMNWHIELLVEYLEAVTAGEIKRLLINVPPRMTKSRSVSVLWPSWCWARTPKDKLSDEDILTGSQSRWIFASYADELSTEHSVDRRTVMESPWYRRRWGDRVAFTRDQNRKTHYTNIQRGTMYAVSIAGAAGLGVGGDCLPADVAILTEIGKIEIGALFEMERPPRVLSFNHQRGECEYRRIVAARRTTTDDLVEFTSRTGKTLRCTPRHRIYSGGEYRRAGSIRAGNNFLALRRVSPALQRLPLGDAEAYPAWLEASLLRTSLCGLGLHTEARPSMRAVRQDCAERRTRGQGRETVPAVCAEGASRATREETRGAQADMSTVPPPFSAEIYARAVLFTPMRGHGSLDPYGWAGQSPVQGRSCERQMVPLDETSDFPARQESVREMRGGESRNDEIWADGSSYRQGSNRQQGGESCGSLSALSREASQIEAVEMVRRIRTPNLPVYDLQVEGNGNFFANEILVHNCIVIDDPHDTKQAQSEADRKSAIETFRSSLSTRHNDKKRGVMVIIMQRLAELDLSGHVLELGGWEHLKIEGECEEPQTYVFPRTKQTIVRGMDHTERHKPDGTLISSVADGGLLWPAREGPKEIAERKLNLGSLGFASQYQQRPSPKGGYLFKHSWWRYWRALPRLHSTIMVLDTAYEEGDTNSFSNCDVWGFADIGFVLADNWHMQVEFSELKRSTIWMAAKWNPEVILIEARASGKSLIQELKRPVPIGSDEPALHASIPIVPIEPEVDKYTRAVAVTPIPEAGLIWLPDKTIPGYEWVGDYEAELEHFPTGKLNDRVDTLVHGVTYLRGQGSIVDFYRRMSQHQDAVEKAQVAESRGRPAPAAPGNSVLDAYYRSQEVWRQRAEEEARRR
jgi:predicted phage terminase large subunit-like protein